MRDLTKQEFEIYCLFYAAADLKIKKEELFEIGAEVEHHTFTKIHDWFCADNDAERADVIMKYKLYIKTEEERQMLLDEIKNIFFTDGRFDSAEKSIFSVLKRVL